MGREAEKGLALDLAYVRVHVMAKQTRPLEGWGLPAPKGGSSATQDTIVRWNTRRL